VQLQLKSNCLKLFQSPVKRLDRLKEGKLLGNNGCEVEEHACITFSREKQSGGLILMTLACGPSVLNRIPSSRRSFRIKSLARRVFGSRDFRSFTMSSPKNRPTPLQTNYSCCHSIQIVKGNSGKRSVNSNVKENDQTST
jgi:hypothetical protein